MPSVENDALRAVVIETLNAHARKIVQRKDGVPPLDVHCMCGWTHPDRFIKNPAIHREHVADELVAALRVIPPDKEDA